MSRQTTLIIGLEIHVELATRSKMFTRAPSIAHPNHFEAQPNTLVDPLTAALPGTLPVMNRRAVELAMQVGLALNCSIATQTKWDRKNYFYPDLPKGYQISQYDEPLCFDGALDIPGEDGSTKRIGILRAHLEEDAGKLGHELPGGAECDGTLVDLNRAGTPLLEIVTEPDFRSAADVVTFCRELRNICRFLGVSECILQRGQMRFEPNINVEIEDEHGRLHRTPIVEIKNLNSYRSVQSAIEHEHVRQIDEWQETGRVMGLGEKTTRGWDDINGRTFLQRSKEDAHDYRYFPDPDLPPVVISEAWKQRIADSIPELPIQRRKRYEHDYGLSDVDCHALTAERDACIFFESAIDAVVDDDESNLSRPAAAQAVAKMLLNIGAQLANERECELHELGITSRQVAQVIILREHDSIGSSGADKLFALLSDRDGDAAGVAEAEGLLQVRDESALDEWIAQALEAQVQAAADYAAGKDAALGRLVGEVMKRSRGQAAAPDVQKRLRERLRG